LVSQKGIDALFGQTRFSKVDKQVCAHDNERYQKMIPLSEEKVSGYPVHQHVQIEMRRASLSGVLAGHPAGRLQQEIGQKMRGQQTEQEEGAHCTCCLIMVWYRLINSSMASHPDVLRLALTAGWVMPSEVAMAVWVFP